MSNNEWRMPKEKIEINKLRHSKFVVRHSIFIQFISFRARDTAVNELWKRISF